jgi:hypothetical protein
MHSSIRFSEQCSSVLRIGRHRIHGPNHQPVESHLKGKSFRLKLGDLGWIIAKSAPSASA